MSVFFLASMTLIWNKRKQWFQKHCVSMTRNSSDQWNCYEPQPQAWREAPGQHCYHSKQQRHSYNQMLLSHMWSELKRIIKEISPPSIPSHLQHVVQGRGAEGLACIEQTVARLLHLVLLLPRGLSVSGLRPLQGLTAALKLLTHIFEPTNISGGEEG